MGKIIKSDDFRNSPLVELAERLIGKGFELVIYDPDVDMQKIHGQNRRYIEHKMRHLARLLKPDFDSLVLDSELLIIGKSIEGIAAQVERLPGHRRILDLTRQLPVRGKESAVCHVESLTV